MINNAENKSFEQLKVKNQTVKAVYFHKPEEKNGYLSNWYPATFVLDGQTFTSTEQYIMYSKCKLCGHEEHMAQIMNTNDPAIQQAIGQGKDMDYDSVDQAWRGMRQAVAHRCLKAKFSQNEDLLKKLLATGDAWLVECANFDKNWACGISLYDEARKDTKNWQGTNILGFTLMEVREELRKG